MSENASHVVVHHYIEHSPGFNCDGVACCVVLIAVVVALFLIVAGVVAYAIVYYLSGRRRSRRPGQHRTSRGLLRGYDNDAMHASSGDAAASAEREIVVGEGDDNVQSIPMATFRTDGRDSSDSSAGLYDVLFPEQHEGEVLYDPPAKLVTFAGQVYAPGSRPGSDAGPSGHGDSESLVWDYFQATDHSDPGPIDNICWV